MSNLSLIIATYNVRVPCDPAPYDWASRKPRMKWLIKKNNFHLFGLQEAVKEQIDDILEGTSYQYIGGGRDDFKDAGEHSCIVYDSERLELIEGGTFGLSEFPDVPGTRSWGTCCPRIASWGKFRDKINNVEFCCYNTHLDHVSELARVKGIRMVVEHAKKNANGLPMLLIGDFNAIPNSETYHVAAELLRDARSISETEHEGPNRTFQNYGMTTKDEPIDYIFVSQEIRVLAHRADDRKPGGEFASDHYPLVAEIII